MPRRRLMPVNSSESNASAHASFLRDYVGYLLPALTTAAHSLSSCTATEDEKIEKAVRFEVDMALVLSASEFKWSQALRNKLEHHSQDEALPISYNIHFMSKCHGIIRKLRPSRPNSVVSRSVAHVNVLRSRNPTLRSCSKKSRGGDGFDPRMRTLRRILPGGSAMGLHELLFEAKSYMVCLQL